MEHIVTVKGFGGYLASGESNSLVMAKDLIHNGYDVQINGLAVRFNFTSQQLEWDAGSMTGEPILID